MNIMFMDGHVETVTPAVGLSTINLQIRYNQY